jgi:site-specific recombinase XerD
MKTSAPTFASLLQDFFYQSLVADRNASKRTVSAYRDSFRLLLRFASARLKKTPTSLAVSDLNATLVVDFLRHLEADRGNSARSRKKIGSDSPKRTMTSDLTASRALANRV